MSFYAGVWGSSRGWFPERGESGHWEERVLLV